MLEKKRQRKRSFSTNSRTGLSVFHFRRLERGLFLAKRLCTAFEWCILQPDLNTRRRGLRTSTESSIHKGTNMPGEGCL